MFAYYVIFLIIWDEVRVKTHTQVFHIIVHLAQVIFGYTLLLIVFCFYSLWTCESSAVWGSAANGATYTQATLYYTAQDSAQRSAPK